MAAVIVVVVAGVIVARVIVAFVTVRVVIMVVIIAFTVRVVVRTALRVRTLAVRDHLVDDSAVFFLEHAGRHREAVAIGQRVQQRALGLGACRLGELALHLLAHRVTQSLQVVEAEALGQRVVDRHRLRRPQDL